MALQCHYFEAGRCRSCTFIETPLDAQLRAKEARCRELLPQIGENAWLPTFSSCDRGFRNRVKLVVGGTSDALTLGILDAEQRGVDLRECLIQAPGIARVIPALAAALERTGLQPYDIRSRRGELKLVHLTESPDDEMMLRFVVRTQHGLDVLRSRLAEIRDAVPCATVISVNLLPQHAALMEGEREEVLFGTTLAMRCGSVTLHLLPGSFFQTNTAVASALYDQVAAWMREVGPTTLWDLYCGVGGFALNCAAAMPESAEITGVEVSVAAVEAARAAARDAGLHADFVAEDATSYALNRSTPPDAVIVNPPRRGIGTELADWIDDSGVAQVVYSSCNPESLARDLERMPAYEVQEARIFDMFPHTSHLEVAVLLRRADSPAGLSETRA